MCNPEMQGNYTQWDKPLAHGRGGPLPLLTDCPEEQSVLQTLKD